MHFSFFVNLKITFVCAFMDGVREQFNQRAIWWSQFLPTVRAMKAILQAAVYPLSHPAECSTCILKL